MACLAVDKHPTCIFSNDIKEHLVLFLDLLDHILYLMRTNIGFTVLKILPFLLVRMSLTRLKL